MKKIPATDLADFLRDPDKIDVVLLHVLDVVDESAGAVFHRQNAIWNENESSSKPIFINDNFFIYDFLFKSCNNYLVTSFSILQFSMVSCSK